MYFSLGCVCVCAMKNKGGRYVPIMAKVIQKDVVCEFKPFWYITRHTQQQYSAHQPRDAGTRKQMDFINGFICLDRHE